MVIRTKLHMNKRQKKTIRENVSRLSLLVIVFCFTSIRRDRCFLAYAAAPDHETTENAYTSKDVASNRLKKQKQYLRLNSIPSVSHSSQQQHQLPLHNEHERRDLKSLVQTVVQAANGDAAASVNNNGGDIKTAEAAPFIALSPTPAAISAPQLAVVGENGNPSDSYPLGLCEGDCDQDSDCEGNLICYQRNGFEPVPGCRGGNAWSSRSDFCVHPDAAETTTTETTVNNIVSAEQMNQIATVQAHSPTTPATNSDPQVVLVGENGNPASSFPLGLCEGDCDKDSDCRGNLICYQRNGGDPVPGCRGGDAWSSRADFCVRPDATENNENNRNPQPVPAPAPQTSAQSPIQNTRPRGSSFKLKMYWQRGYDWQEETIERKWCLRCRSTCTSGREVIVVDCDGDRPNDMSFLYPASNNNNEVQIRVDSYNMCLERRSSDAMEIYLQTCNSDKEAQRWMLANRRSGANGVVERYEITPKGNSNWCVTQPHHPKFGEVIRLMACSNARKADTSFWNMY